MGRTRRKRGGEPMACDRYKGKDGKYVKCEAIKIPYEKLQKIINGLWAGTNLKWEDVDGDAKIGFVSQIMQEPEGKKTVNAIINHSEWEILKNTYTNKLITENEYEGNIKYNDIADFILRFINENPELVEKETKGGRRTRRKKRRKSRRRRRKRTKKKRRRKSRRRRRR